MISTVWRRLSQAQAFKEGAKIKLSDFNRVPFDNNYNKVVEMHQARLYHSNNTPFQLQSDKYTNEMAKLHKELNFLNSRLFMKRILLLYTILGVYYFFIKEEEAKDWCDKFDVKQNIKAFGSLDDSSGEGNIAIDD
jgi:hypothetical protein